MKKDLTVQRFQNEYEGFKWKAGLVSFAVTKNIWIKLHLQKCNFFVLFPKGNQAIVADVRRRNEGE
ncbi:hypothetical protein ACYSNR_03540 [Enterococcus sp. LJL128]|uniref:hypothetical protein n=1 Tax=Enterococcus sp. LJL51 TaxID=3416656 RepID=UPI003CF6DEFA